MDRLKEKHTSFPKVPQKRWRRVWIEGEGVPIKTGKYGEPVWATVGGDGEILDVIAKKFIGKALNVDFAVKVQEYGEYELWEEVSELYEYKVTTSNTDYSSEILKIGSPVRTGLTDWRPNGNVTGSSIKGVKVCPITCDTLIGN